MEKTEIEDRPLADPDMYSFRPLAETNEACRAAFAEMAEFMRERGAEEIRMTIVSPEYPMQPYPDGLYVEGWLTAPHKMETPHKAAPFNYPIVAA